MSLNTDAERLSAIYPFHRLTQKIPKNSLPLRVACTDTNTRLEHR